jgi:DNA invertase Pin-like site-specific DNA recombinase
MLIGYARVSTHDQTLNLQRDALEKAGCTKIFTDTASGAKTERQGLEEALNYVRKGDTLVVWRLDRLERSLPHIFGALAEFERNLIRERTQAGLSAARGRGRRGGRPKALTDRQISIAQSLYADKKNLYS